MRILLTLIVLALVVWTAVIKFSLLTLKSIFYDVPLRTYKETMQVASAYMDLIWDKGKSSVDEWDF